MGDRANVVVVDDDGSAVWFYCHGRGLSAFQRARAAIARRARWSDDSYLARIVYDALVKGDEGTETGFGISTGPTGSQRPVLVIFPAHQKVASYPNDMENALPRLFRDAAGRRKIPEGILSAMSFEDFAKLADHQVEAFVEGKDWPRPDMKRMEIVVTVEGYGEEALPELERLVEQGIARTLEKEIAGRTTLFRLVGTTVQLEPDMEE